MLISYPFLAGANFKETYRLPDLKEDEGRGLYPITTREAWHGGLHLVQMATRSGVRAIADGTVIAYRVPAPRPADEASQLEHPLGLAYWTDDGFVLMKHEKECGEGRPVVFYSLYMHLSEITHEDLKKLNTGVGKLKASPRKQVKVKGETKEEPIVIKRKESFAEPGFINGRNKRIHIEIFTDTASLDAFFKPGDGATDPWGDLYFKLPKGTAYVRDPKPAQTDGTLAEDMLLAVRYADGARIVTWLDEETGEELMAPRSFPGVENDLYQAAKAMGGGTLSRGYEMARFGRLMEWKELNDDPPPAKPHCWLELPTGGYVDVAPGEIKKFTDADFPAWKWKKLEAAPLLDLATGTWKLPDLLADMDANGDGTLTVAEVEGWLKTEANRMALRRLVVKAQSEWDGGNADDRWGYVKKLMAKDPEMKRSALKRKLEWLEAQRSQAEKALPRLDERLVGWEIRLSSLAKDQDKAKETAQAAKDREKEADTTLKTLKAKTLPQIQAMGKQTWKDQVKAAEEALAEAKRERQRAEAQVEQDERAMAQAKVWMGRDTLKAAAARDLIASEPTRKAALEKDLKALEGATVKQEDQTAAAEAFEKFKAHIAALQWWMEVKKEVKDFPASTDVWHFHPLHFIERMKQCHWLSKDELEAIYPDSYKTSGQIVEDHRIHLNRVMWKYGTTTSTRMAYLLGQVQQESGGLTKFKESISEDKANTQYGDRQDLGNTEEGDGYRFIGRGMKQLTGRYNYMKYWVYRGGLDSSWLNKRWFFTKSEEGKSAEEKAKIKKTLSSPPPIKHPEDAEKPFNAVDTGGYYWLNGASSKAGCPIARRLREGQIDRATANAVSKDVNPYEKGAPTIHREFNTYRIWDVVGDDVTPKYDAKAREKALEPYQKPKKK